MWSRRHRAHFMAQRGAVIDFRIAASGALSSKRTLSPSRLTPSSPKSRSRSTVAGASFQPR